MQSLFKTPVTMEATRPEHTSKGCTCVCSSTTLISAHITITCTHHCNTHNSIMSGGCRDQGGKTKFPARVYNNIPHYLSYQVPRTVMLSQVLPDNTLCKVASRSEDQPPRSASQGFSVFVNQLNRGSFCAAIM